MHDALVSAFDVAFTYFMLGMLRYNALSSIAYIRWARGLLFHNCCLVFCPFTLQVLGLTER